MHGLLYRLRGIHSWPETQAQVTEIQELSRGGRGGDWNRVVFTYRPAAEEESGTIKVDSYSSLFNLSTGDRFPIQYDPNRTGRFYVEEAKSLFSTVHYVIAAIGVLFAVAIVLIDFLGR